MKYLIPYDSVRGEKMQVTIEINNEAWEQIGFRAFDVSNGILDAKDVLLAVLEDAFGEDNVRLAS